MTRRLPPPKPQRRLPPPKPQRRGGVDADLILLDHSPTWINVEPLPIGKTKEYTRRVGETEESYAKRVLGEHAAREWAAKKRENGQLKSKVGKPYVSEVLDDRYYDA